MSNLLFFLPLLFLPAVLCWMGRRWWCECGEWQVIGRGAEHYSQHVLDAWSVSHFGHGIFFYGLVRGFAPRAEAWVSVLATLYIEAVWELVENTPWVITLYRRSGDVAYYGDSIANSLGDLGVCLLGALLTSRFV